LTEEISSFWQISIFYTIIWGNNPKWRTT